MRKSISVQSCDSVPPAPDFMVRMALRRSLGDVALFACEMQISLDIAGDARELLVGGDAIFGAFALLQNLLGFFLILPEVGLGADRFEFG
jgi:uncharacterized membrane protein